MAEQKFELRAVGVDYLCDTCGGPMRPTGVMLLSAPPQWPHACKQGHAAAFREKYPTVRYERADPPPPQAQGQQQGEA